MSAVLTRQPRRTPRSADTVRYILEAADRLRQAEGLAAVTLKRVAAVAGVGIGTVYHHFPDRSALLRECEQRAWDAELAGLLTRIQKLVMTARVIDGGPAPAPSRTTELARAFIAAAVDSALSRIDTHGVALDDPALRDLMFDYFDRIAERVHGLLVTMPLELRGPDSRRRVLLGTEVVAMMTWVAAIRHREDLRSGAFQRDLAELLCRYLLVSPEAA